MLFSIRSGLTSLAELRGRRVVVPQYWFTPTVWQRMIVQDEYGIRPEEMSWLCLQPERFDPPGVPGGVRVDYDSSGRSARDVLADGDADASLGSGPRGPDDAIRPAFPDPLQAQRDFYLRTGISSLQHVTVVKEELASGELVAALCDLYERAKEQANPEPPAGMGDLLGDDPWHFGIAANRTTLEALLRAAHTQGMIARSMQVEELFAPNLPLQYR
jgi:4,5-dihydroxyphthalate decarboxylase